MSTMKIYRYYSNPSAILQAQVSLLSLGALAQVQKSCTNDHCINPLLSRGVRLHEFKPQYMNSGNRKYRRRNILHWPFPTLQPDISSLTQFNDYHESSGSLKHFIKQLHDPILSTSYSKGIFSSNKKSLLVWFGGCKLPFLLFKTVSIPQRIIYKVLVATVRRGWGLSRSSYVTGDLPTSKIPENHELKKTILPTKLFIIDILPKIEI